MVSEIMEVTTLMDDGLQAYHDLLQRQISRMEGQQISLDNASYLPWRRAKQKRRNADELEAKYGLAIAAYHRLNKER